MLTTIQYFLDMQQANLSITDFPFHHTKHLLLRRMILECHRGSIKATTIVAPKSEETATVSLTRQLASTVLETGVHCRE